MSGLPKISGKECAAIFEKIGFIFVRQHGSHLIYKRNNPYAQTTIPNHKELDRGTLRAIIRQAGLSTNEFMDLYNNK
ncbi:MAG TPA: type II toxin-antitoxin system HicA family toxin [Spirochaetota bacterium]|jgi:predicted RNA binding protein YcfA (HicA-like mRNA interferase family)|nr:MAG: YcfA-like protein [Spirochaetes bacterium ADurb.Bin133]HNZ26066.1 type II toxin-antitoxin system HicA family toxin [Spirochaetota bacterium]HPY86543.1 type II toxin-antitoxin system HicA family toxin [Spirochaetota bacterium]HQB61517.1 type II toxin-antitoxin system HicA family toxin [Spirochaetota bacterium]